MSDSFVAQIRAAFAAYRRSVGDYHQAERGADSARAVGVIEETYQTLVRLACKLPGLSMPPGPVARWQGDWSDWGPWLASVDRWGVELEARLAALAGDKGPAENPKEDDAPLSLRRVGQMWYLRYHNEKADFPEKGNNFLGWLVKLLSKPGYAWTVAELYSDPEGKLKADALLGGERLADREGIRAIRKQIEDIDAMIEATGDSEALENEKVRLLMEVEGHSATRRIGSTVASAYNNIATQKRAFIKKLSIDMPQLAAHLRGSIFLSASDYTISYRPPSGSPSWHVENPPKNPTA